MYIDPCIEQGVGLDGLVGPFPLYDSIFSNTYSQASIKGRYGQAPAKSPHPNRGPLRRAPWTFSSSTPLQPACLPVSCSGPDNGGGAVDAVAYSRLGVLPLKQASSRNVEKEEEAQ